MLQKTKRNKNHSKIKGVCATEQQDQIAFIQYAKTDRILSQYLFAIPNGGSRHYLEAINLKKMGVKIGSGFWIG